MVAGGEIRILIQHVHEDVRNSNAVVNPACPTKKPFSERFQTILSRTVSWIDIWFCVE